MAEKFDINTLYARYWRYVALPFPTLVNAGSQISALQNVDQLFKGSSDFGPIRYPVSLAIPGQEASGLAFNLPNEPMISVKGSKQVIVTAISRGLAANGTYRKGTVKEDIYTRDYSIEIKGFIIGEDENLIPEAEKADFIRMCEYPGSLVVKSKVLNTTGINMVEITDWDLIEEAGLGYNIIPYIITALSDEDFEIDLITGN